MVLCKVWAYTRNMGDEFFEKSSELYRDLHRISNGLHLLETMDELYRTLIEHGRQILGIERIGLLLIDQAKNQMIGTFGTDLEGNTADERSMRIPIPEKDQLFAQSIEERDFVVMRETTDLFHMGKKIGTGWHAMYALWDGDKPFAWLAADNFVTGRRVEPWQHQLFGLLGAFSASLILRKRHEISLQALVDEKVNEILRLRENLEQSQRLASLGRMVSGISHDMNTPLGTAITANSFLLAQLNQIVSCSYDDLPPSVLPLLNQSLEGSVLVEKSLRRTDRLLSRFKDLASSPVSTMDAEPVILEPFFNKIIQGFQGQLNQAGIKLELSLAKDLAIKTWPRCLVQMVGILMENTLQHAYRPGTNGGLIKVSVSRERNQISGKSVLVVSWSDDGRGLDEDIKQNLWDPFVTTRRNQGSSGLGLGILFNLVTVQLTGTIKHFLPFGGGAGFLITLPIPN